jgi:hypothetical protein
MEAVKNLLEFAGQAVAAGRNNRYICPLNKN